MDISSQQIRNFIPYSNLEYDPPERLLNLKGFQAYRLDKTKNVT